MTDTTGAVWHKSTRSNNGGACVEVATNLHESTGFVLVRDTKDHGAGPILEVPAAAWRTFTDAVRDGKFDH